MERMATAEFGWHPSCGKGTGDVWWRKCHLHPTTEGKLQTYHCPFGGVKNEQVGICSRQFQLNMLSSEGISGENGEKLQYATECVMGSTYCTIAMTCLQLRNVFQIL